MEPLKHRDIFGNWATPLLATEKDGTVNYSKMADEIDIIISSGPNGIYSNGTAAEFYSQTEEEFDRISDMLAAKCSKAGIPYQIGVSHMSPQISLERLRRIRHLRPGAVQLILPDWFPVTPEETVVFMRKMEEEAEGISLILYNPPHAKRQVPSAEWASLKKEIRAFQGVKVADKNGDLQWYRTMIQNKEGLSVFIPGHRLATGVANGADGAYSNMSCLNPFMAQKWYNMIKSDLQAAFELEKRIAHFRRKLMVPFITEQHFANHACDRFLVMLGGWADIGPNLRWPYKSIPEELVEPVRKEAIRIIPEFFKK